MNVCAVPQEEPSSIALPPPVRDIPHAHHRRFDSISRVNRAQPMSLMVRRKSNALRSSLLLSRTTTH